MREAEKSAEPFQLLCACAGSVFPSFAKAGEHVESAVRNTYDLPHSRVRLQPVPQQLVFLHRAIRDVASFEISEKTCEQEWGKMGGPSRLYWRRMTRHTLPLPA